MTVQKTFRNAVVEAIIESLATLIEKAATSSPANFTFHRSKELGGPCLLDGLWHKLGMAEVIHPLVAGRVQAALGDRESIQGLKAYPGYTASLS